MDGIGHRYKRAGGEWHELDGDRYNKLGSHVSMFSQFRDAVVTSDDAHPWISPVECVRTVAAVEAAYRSLAAGGWEHVDTRVMPEYPAVAHAPA